MRGLLPGPYADAPPEVAALQHVSYDELPTLLKAAKWLIEEVGVGNTFTVVQLKQRFPNVSQIDRRMRDLRPAGWQILTNKDDPALPVAQLRLHAIGGLEAPKAVSGRTRREIFDRDQNRCVVCGIGAGEPYDDDPEARARLTIGHWLPKGQQGDPLDENNLRTECFRCNHSAQDQTGAVTLPGSVRARVDALPRREKQELLSWMDVGRRPQSRTEQLWYEWRQLPPAARDEIHARLRETVSGTQPLLIAEPPISD